MGKAIDLRRRGLVIAAAAGSGVLAVTIVQDILLSLGSLVAGFVYSASLGQYVGMMAQGAVIESLTTTLPFGVGVFLCLWQIAPVAPPLRFVHVVSRSVLASGVGAAASFAVSFVVSTITGLGQVAGLTFFGTAFPVGETLDAMGFALGTAVQQAVGVFVTQVPLVVLAGLVVWLWARERDKAVDLEGALDL